MFITISLYKITFLNLQLTQTNSLGYLTVKEAFLKLVLKIHDSINSFLIKDLKSYLTLEPS